MNEQVIRKSELVNLKALRHQLDGQEISAPVINQVLGFMADSLLEKDAYGVPTMSFIKAARLNKLLHDMERSDVETVAALASPENRRHLTVIAQQLFSHADKNEIGSIGHANIMGRMAAGIFPEHVSVTRPSDERTIGDQREKPVSRPS